MTTRPAVTLVLSSCHIKLTDAPEIVDDRGRPFVPHIAIWSRTWAEWHAVHGITDDTYCVLYDRDLNRSRFFLADEVPGWVPRPHDEWDVGARQAEAALP